jgi:O-acetyl-ADP-ribose deacetylase (regulator of RNase III)
MLQTLVFSMVGGVAGSIVRKGGRIIQEESNKINYVPTGSAVIIVLDDFNVIM